MRQPSSRREQAFDSLAAGPSEVQARPFTRALRHGMADIDVAETSGRWRSRLARWQERHRPLPRGAVRELGRALARAHGRIPLPIRAWTWGWAIVLVALAGLGGRMA